MPQNNPVEANPVESNLIDELRLRRWARCNYVPQAERNARWNEIVLEEMRRKDDEIAEFSENQVLTSTYVPLAPTVFHTIHTAHAECSEPEGPAIANGVKSEDSALKTVR